MALTTLHAAATFEVKFMSTLLCNVIEGEAPHRRRQAGLVLSGPRRCDCKLWGMGRPLRHLRRWDGG